MFCKKNLPITKAGPHFVFIILMTIRAEESIAFSVKVKMTFCNLAISQLKKMAFQKEHDLADEYYNYKGDDVGFTHLVRLDAIYYCFI